MWEMLVFLIELSDDNLIEYIFYILGFTDLLIYVICNQDVCNFFADGGLVSW